MLWLCSRHFTGAADKNGSLGSRLGQGLRDLLPTCAALRRPLRGVARLGRRPPPDSRLPAQALLAASAMQTAPLPTKKKGCKGCKGCGWSSPSHLSTLCSGLWTLALASNLSRRRRSKLLRSRCPGDRKSSRIASQAARSLEPLPVGLQESA